MVKQSPSRNYRSKGFKVKHVLQICVLLAICFWLIYQVKHSYDKKREFDEDDSVKTHVPDEVLKFGRKDLQPRLREQTLRNGKVDEDVDEEETGAEEVNNNEEEEQEEDNKNYEKEDEAKGGDDEGDEGDEEKPETEVELEDFFVDGEKEREGGEKEAEEIDLEDMEGGQKGNMSSLQEHERDGGSSISRNSHEAREENYRADDASSAVTHETEPETGMFNSNENTGRKVVEEEASDKSNTTTGIKSEKGEMGENGISTNAITKEDRGSETSSEKLEGTSLSNSTVTADSSNLLEVSDNSTNGSLKTNTLLLQNRTEMKPDVTEAQNVAIPLVKGNEYDTASNNDQSNSNMVNSGNTGNADAAVTGEFANSSMTAASETALSEKVVAEFANSSMTAASETALSEKVVASNSSVEVEGHSGLSKMEENTQNKSETSNGTNKSQDSSESQNAGAVQQDPIDSTDSSVTLDKKDVTLPEIRAEGTKNGDAAAQ